ncbi:MAG: hypothetical protein LC689_07905 [Myxococcales bacterium]|nr:hypothetical protein [Myxococcales bacterium]
MAALLLAALLGARLDAAVETSGHAGSDPLANTADVEPSLTLHLDAPATQFQLRYAPRLLGNSDGALTRQSAALNARWTADRLWTWSAAARFREGRSELAWDGIENILPLIRDEIFFDGNAGFSYTPARGWSIDVTAGWFTYGGLSDASQQSIPLQIGPQVYAAVHQVVTRSDELMYELYDSYTSATGGRHTSLLKLNAGWKHELTPSARFLVTAGASDDPTIRPIGSAELQYQASRSLELRARAAVGPHYSLATADLRDRAELQAGARLALNELSLSARVAGAKELDAGGVLGIVAGEAGYRLGPALSLAAGVETIRQRPAPDSAWTAFAALTAGAQDIF